MQHRCGWQCRAFDLESFRGKVLIFTTAQSAKTLELDDNDNLQDTFIPKRRGKDISDQFLILTPDFSGQENSPPA